MAKKTQGTSLFALIPGSSPIIARITCVTSITGLGAGARDQIDVTCLEDLTDRQFEAGLASPSAVSFSVNYDPADIGYEQLYQLKESGEKTQFFIGLSDGPLSAAPTLGVGDAITFPNTRSFLEFTGFVSEFPFDFAQNSVITSAITVQRSGEVVRHLKP